MLDQYYVLKEIKAAINDYEMATNVNCYLFDGVGKKMGNRSCYDCANICNFIKPYDQKGVCVHDYVCNCQQTLETTDAHFYLCPYGLLNITIPIFLDDNTAYFASTGPILIHAPNKYIINRFLEQNELVQSRYEDVKQLLAQVPLKDSSHLTALSNTLQRSVQNVQGSSSNFIQFQTKQNLIGNVIQALKKEARSNLYPACNEEYYILQKEIELLDQKGEFAKSQKALETILYRFIDNIHKHNVFEESKYGSARFFDTLLEIAKRSNLNLESIFGKQCSIIAELLRATNNEQLNGILYGIIPRFQQAFLTGSTYKTNENILRSLEYIHEHYSDITLQKLANTVALNPSYLSNMFKKEMGQTYSDYLNKVRVGASKQYLRDHMPLSQIAQAVGFTDQSYFIKIFKRYEGVSPSKWVK